MSSLSLLSHIVVELLFFLFLVCCLSLFENLPRCEIAVLSFNCFYSLNLWNCYYKCIFKSVDIFYLE